MKDNRRLKLLAALLMVGGSATACGVTDEGEAASVTSGTGESGDSAADGATSSESGSTGEGDDGGSVWDEVPCGTDVCGLSEICVQPGDACDYSGCDNGGMASWIERTPFCAAVPAACDPDSSGCLANEHCADGEAISFVDGLLACWPAPDCFC